MDDKTFDLSGKMAIVTGASRGLGQYFGRALARAGADLIITARNLASLEGFRGEIEGLGRRASSPGARSEELRKHSEHGGSRRSRLRKDRYPG